MQTPFGASTIYPAIGYSFGGMIGYDFVGPRVEIEGLYNNSKSTISGSSATFGGPKDEIAVMANLLYDFNAGGVWVPYIGAGAGVAFEKFSALNTQDNNTVFAYQGRVGSYRRKAPTCAATAPG